MKSRVLHNAAAVVFDGSKPVEVGLFDGSTHVEDVKKRMEKAHPKAEEVVLTFDHLQVLRKEIPVEVLVQRAIDQSSHAVKSAVGKDTLIIQTIKAVDEVTALINHLTKRLREWYSFSLPELSRGTEDNLAFVHHVLKDRKEIVKELSIDEEHSLGTPLPQKDIAQMQEVARTILRMEEQQEQHLAYIEELMQEICPNVLALTGARIGAKLLEHARSLAHLAKLPSSTIQTLGAEKALFRHLAYKTKSPKHGVLISHPLVSHAKEKGKVARSLANKISIAAKIDFFGDDQYAGYQLSEDLEKRWKG